MKGFLNTFGIIVISIVLMIFGSLFIGIFVMLLWNWLMPSIFSLGVITYWQAVGLYLLASLLFKSVVNTKIKEKRGYEH